MYGWNDPSSTYNWGDDLSVKRFIIVTMMVVMMSLLVVSMLEESDATDYSGTRIGYASENGSDYKMTVFYYKNSNTTGDLSYQKDWLECRHH